MVEERVTATAVRESLAGVVVALRTTVVVRVGSMAVVGVGTATATV